MALWEFYIRDYYSNGSLVSQETCFQTIPMTAGDPAMISPKIKASMGKSGSFSFSLYQDHPLYNSMKQYKTKLRVVYDGHELFNGRVITIGKSSERMHVINCEGIFSYFLDSHQPGTEEDIRPVITVLQYMQQLIAQHNSDVEADKQIVLGEVPGQYTNAIAADQRVVIPEQYANQKFGNSSWNTTMDRLEDLLGDFGGYMRIRHENGQNYLDWFDKYYSSQINPQWVEAARNLIDLSGTAELDNLFTVVIPIGKDESENVFVDAFWPVAQSGHAAVQYIEVPEIASLLPDEKLNTGYHRKTDYQNAISDYGRIWKQIEFDNANTPEKLFNYALEWIRDNYMPELTQWSVTALDMRIPGERLIPLIVGDRVVLDHPEVDNRFGSLTIIEADYDPYNMEKTKYTIGTPNQQVNGSYGVKNVKDKTASGKSGGGYSRRKQNDDQTEYDVEKTRLKLHLENQYSLKTDFDSDIYLDDPLAFTIHDTTGSQQDQKTVAKKAAEVIPKLVRTRMTLTPEQLTEAIRNGVSPDDPGFLIEHTPDLKREQTKWKNDTEYYFIHDLGLTEQESALLLNEKAGTSWLASLVDDNGEWTAKARSEGWGSVRAHSAEIKQMAFDSRKMLNDTSTNKRSNPYLGAKNYLVGGSLDVGNLVNTDEIIDNLNNQVTKYVSFLGGSSNFDISESLSGVEGWINKGFDFLGGAFNGSNNTANNGEQTGIVGFFNGLFSGSKNTATNGDQTGIVGFLNGAFSGSKDKKNTGAENSTMNLLGGLFRGEIGLNDLGEQLKSKFNLTSKTVDIDGGDAGTAKIGKSQGGDWLTKINDTITYQDENGEWRTASGFVTAEDFHIRDIPSFKTRFAYIETAYIGVAYLDTILANDAFIKNITGNQIVAGTLIRSAAGYFTDAWAKDFHCTGGYLYTGETGSGSQYTVHIEKCYNYFDISEKDGVVTLSMTAADGSRTDTKTFNMASTQFFIDAVEAAEEKGREEGGGEITISIDDIYDTNTPPTGTTATTISHLIATTDKDFITFRVNAGGEKKRYNIEL